MSKTFWETNILDCHHCSARMSYPWNADYVRCPSCQNIQNPHEPTHNYSSCLKCATTLSFPVSALTIQCRMCMHIMDLPLLDKPVHTETQPPKKRRKADPNAPKRASNAYMIFCKEHRSKLKEEYPDLAFGKTGAKLGEIWRAMAATEKQPYLDLATTDRMRHREEMRQYEEAGGQTVQETSFLQNQKQLQFLQQHLEQMEHRQRFTLPQEQRHSSSPELPIPHSPSPHQHHNVHSLADPFYEQFEQRHDARTPPPTPGTPTTGQRRPPWCSAYVA